MAQWYRCRRASPGSGHPVTLSLVFPHQLFDPHPALHPQRPVLLVEDSLFFGDPRYPLDIHRHRITLHTASLAAWQQRMEARGVTVERVPWQPGRMLPDLAEPFLPPAVEELHVCYLADDILTRRVHRLAERRGAAVVWYPSPMFLSPADWLDEQLKSRTPGGGPGKMHQFYSAQRRRMGLLMEDRRDGSAGDTGSSPRGGRWSFDTENRQSWPRGRTPPPDPGDDERAFWFPVTHEDARDALEVFLVERLPEFGPFEDAISREGTVLYHSVLTPALNTGLLTPADVLSAMQHRGLLDIPASDTMFAGVEGFIRQVIGWREYIHGLYRLYGVRQRTSNFWDHQHPMPDSFYTGTTGLLPLDTVIHRVQNRAYCHHIERLMILGNAMLLCEIHPTAVYRWFMELFIDAYDWVMVPNVYGMSQFADGGLMATKPYISGANYIRSMSDYPRGGWEEIWTALFWRFLAKHRVFFRAQPRMGMLTRRLDGDPSWIARQCRIADEYLTDLHGGCVR